MLECFFPKPKQFFSSLVIWIIIVVFSWYFGGKEFGTNFGFNFVAEDAPPVIGLGHFTTPDFQWFYIYFALITGIFYGHFRDCNFRQTFFSPYMSLF